MTPTARRWLLIAAALVGPAVAAVVAGRFLFPDAPSPPTAPPAAVRDPRQLAAMKHATVWWDFPAALAAAAPPAGSNIHPADYAGAESCQKCHPGNYEAWSHHPHRFMNVLATPDTVRGDFSGTASIAYRGGTAYFEKAGDQYRMRLERGDVKRVYAITQTIGSRFFQYYVGRLLAGPEPTDHHFYHKDHVLPFGYWFDQKEWVPTVHVGPELPDDQRPDPFMPPDSGRHYAEYSASCNTCHTTFAGADLLTRRPQLMGEFAPAGVQLHWSVHDYLKDSRPAEVKPLTRSLTDPTAPNPTNFWDAEHYAVSFGVTCEACHFGSKEHVTSNGTVNPRFTPASPNLRVEGAPKDAGRTTENVNWACGRCHVGNRPTFAAGMSTWNSVEFSDAAKGSCYSQMRCTDCHNPHEALGVAWKRPPEKDDAVCLKCHGQYTAADRRAAHTHHPARSDGDRCLNCHMPRVNEGLQDVVRTHMVHSPTRADLIEANHPNACNLCHVDKPIDWTLGRLKDWYGKTYSEGKVALNYKDRNRAVGDGWLASDNEALRLVAADAIARTRNPAAIPKLLAALDDPYLLNRQFAARSLEQMLGVRPADAGYRFWQSKAERQTPLAALREKVKPK